jgi:hypothetical protein
MNYLEIIAVIIWWEISMRIIRWVKGWWAMREYMKMLTKQKELAELELKVKEKRFRERNLK